MKPNFVKQKSKQTANKDRIVCWNTLFLPHLDIPNPPLVNLSEIVLRHFDTNLPIHFLKKVLYLKKIGHTTTFAIYCLGLLLNFF